MGLRSPMCRTNFPAGEHNANTLTILVHLQLMCAQRGEDIALSWKTKVAVNKKKTPAVNSQSASIQSFVITAAVWPEFPLSNYASPLTHNSTPPPFGCSGGPRVDNGTNRNVDQHTYSTSIGLHAHTPVLHRLVAVHIAADIRQTDRAIGIGRV